MTDGQTHSVQQNLSMDRPVVKERATDPLWYKDAIIYETHVKAFFDSNRDGIGDFQGLIEKLDYLQDLGITCLWLLPFFPSPLRDDGYDIADYEDVHPSYGTLQDFKRFLGAAHDRNLQVIIELVINHTSDRHPWFQRAREAQPNSPERDFYVWSDTNKRYSDARIIFTDTEKSNWAWDPVANAYYWHRFYSHQPDLNFDNPAVLEHVIRAMKFWLDMGVDGLRLDAIPYLVEREGTNCENLPETHALIKSIRRELDRYENRLMLAEANQWPTDVRPYFGDGDECHMAFHFPVMPRIFMGLRMEDRHPITEIMTQTPEIPTNCQWGMFLRNHDELTLEMVTADERDYMYLAYSADPRMKINVGIRRRLAPLMENDRRRIELLNSLLLSFPGTPIIYYGDEIGMGDNIYLGDRNGVRTPMQWSPDRNAGFSKADPARVYSPIIMDPVYGYQAVNVEAQMNDASSLFHWMRNMIALRKLFKVFGRGTIEFLQPKNRKVLAYLRRYENDQILCVANLSRFAQPVELDLSSFAGMKPTEMFGYSEFPLVGTTSYQLSLNPYGFYWFELNRAAEPIEVRSALEVEEVTELSVTGWRDLFESETGELLETQVLPKFLLHQPWFRGKGQQIDSVRIHDWVEFRGYAPLLAIALVRVRYSDRHLETYSLPLVITLSAARLSDSNDKTPGNVLCRIRLPQGDGILSDALVDDKACQTLLKVIKSGNEFGTRRGAICVRPFGPFDEVYEALGSQPKVNRGEAEQSDTTVFFGGKLMLKAYRKLESEITPDIEVRRFLAEEAGFKQIPLLAGAIEYDRREAEIETLATFQAAVETEDDGWTLTLDELARYYEYCASLPDKRDTSAVSQEALGLSLNAIRTLACFTAKLHLALASSKTNSAFAPEPLQVEDLNQLSQRCQRNMETAFILVERIMLDQSEESTRAARKLISSKGLLLKRLHAFESSGIQAFKIRVHGNYHLGLVLRAKNDYVAIDFEGEGTRPLSERRAKTSPLKDVAGMLRSLSYAAQVGLVRHINRKAGELQDLLGFARLWERQTSSLFLKTYCEAMTHSRLLPAGNDLRTLLEIFLLERALHELQYEISNRSQWIHIPLYGLLNILEGKAVE
jgi:maltose alpha-D-glucosyltransferase/alpha-amylase